MPTTAESCTAAGCCWAGQSYLKVELFYSDTRHDHFSSINNCSGCQGFNYVDERTQGGIPQNPLDNNQTISLGWYWSAAAADNVLSVWPPTEAGYNLVSNVGYLFTRNGTNRLPVKLWYNAQRQDHFTTFVPADEAEAQAGNYTLLGLMGYAVMASAANFSQPSCYQRQGSADWYFFGHGAQYSQALADYAAIGGRMPLPRRHFLGMSWSKWGNQLNQTVAFQEVAALQAAGFPVDTFIFDMQWHLKPHWTGYTWDPVAYPEHVQMLADIHALGLQIAVNLHDAEGVLPFEKQYAAMAQAMGIDPAGGQTVAFHISNKTYADALSNLLLEPLAEEGLGGWKGINYKLLSKGKILQTLQSGLSSLVHLWPHFFPWLSSTFFSSNSPHV